MTAISPKSRPSEPASGALRRFRASRVAALGACFLALVALAGYGAPLLSAHLTHFSPEEQHTRLAYAPPGTRDVSFDHPTFDGDREAFAALDLDGDGYLTCRRVPAANVALPGLAWAAEHAPTIHAEVLSELDALDAVLPARRIIALQLGELRCPEIDELVRLSRHFDFLFDDYDRVTGDQDPDKAPHRPDGYLTWKEFPEDDAELDPAFRDRGLAGPEAFRKLDIDGDHVLSPWEVTERTRYLRLRHPGIKEQLLARYDADRDLRISRAEFPGVIELHTFYLGTDGSGRDVLTRLFYGARISITIALLAALVALLIGTTYGSIAGYAGGRLDNVMMRFVDVLYGLPYLFIVILLIVITGRSTLNLFIALGCVQWLSLARIVRGQVISLKTRDFVEAARAIGASDGAILFRHILRNAMGPVVVYASLLIPAVILQETFLSFLGLGVQPPDPSWGAMITEGAAKFRDYAWLIVWPGAVLASTLLAMNFVGDGLRDAIDPEMKNP